MKPLNLKTRTERKQKPWKSGNDDDTKKGNELTSGVETKPVKLQPQAIRNRIAEIVKSNDPKHTVGHEVDNALLDLINQTRIRTESWKKIRR